LVSTECVEVDRAAKPTTIPLSYDNAPASVRFVSGGIEGSKDVVVGAPRLADPVLLDRVITELKSIERRSGIDRTLAIGELILTRFFAGNPAHWRDRRRNKNNSIRRLANRADCPFCKSALNEAVAVFVACSELPCVRTFGHISASHVASVLRLTAERRSAILERAEQEQWSVRELRQRVVSERREQGERRGRPSLNAETQAVARLTRLVHELEIAAASLEESAPRGTTTSVEIRNLILKLHRVGVALEGCVSRRSNVVPARTEGERRESA
jgi:hypothetical protein